jgi:HAD superfamily hydrolase (TIGR01509 family)
MKKIRVVLFDLGNVLVQLDLPGFWQSLGFGEPDAHPELKEHTVAVARAYESGSIGTDEFQRQFNGLYADRFSPEELEKAFFSVLPQPIDGMERVVQKVAKDHEVALVSNTNPLHFKLCLGTVPALKNFQRFYVSYELKALKPDESFYRGVIEGEGLEPGEMVFIDDLEENVEGARKTGMKGIVFTGKGELERELVQLGVL